MGDTEDDRYVWDLRERFCEWCCASDEDTYILRCPGCGRLTCRECCYLLDDTMCCMHTRPDERGVVVRSDWNDD